MQNGMFRNDKETAEKALKQIKRFTKLLALRDQECPNSRGYEFVEGGKNNYYIYKNNINGIWSYSYMVTNYSPCEVFFKTEEDAQKICEILNNDRFEL